jgi:hypothetical protein
MASSLAGYMGLVPVSSIPAWRGRYPFLMVTTHFDNNGKPFTNPTMNPPGPDHLLTWPHGSGQCLLIQREHDVRHPLATVRLSISIPSVVGSASAGHVSGHCFHHHGAVRSSKSIRLRNPRLRRTAKETSRPPSWA